MTAKRQKTGGRQKGTPNKTTSLLKDAILKAAEEAGGEGGLVGYLTLQAHENPAAFMSLVGKVLPLQVNAKHEGAISIIVETGGGRAPDE